MQNEDSYRKNDRRTAVSNYSSMAYVDKENE